LDYFYTADKFKDEKGKEPQILAGPGQVNLPSRNNKFEIFTNVTGLFYSSKLKVPFLNARYSASVWSTFGNVVGDVSRGRIDLIKDDKFGYADLYVEPIHLSWEWKRFDLYASYGFWAPTGVYDKDEGTNLGRGRWSHSLNLGMTAYLDKAKSWAVSIAPKYEIYHRQIDYNLTTGDDFLIEWSVSKTFTFWGDNMTPKGPKGPPAGILDFGAIGYNQWQVTDDSGSSATNTSVHDSVHAAGLELGYSIPKWHGFRVHIRHQREFFARDRTQGHVTAFTFTIGF